MTVFPSKGLFRALPGGAFAASSAIVTGDVRLGEDVGIWFGCVVRGDDAPLTIGARTNVQDLTMIHADTGVPNVIGTEVTICFLDVVMSAVQVNPGRMVGTSSSRVITSLKLVA